MRSVARWALASVLLLGIATCASEGEGETRVAVRNGGAASIDAAVSDGDTELLFEGVAAGTTSIFQSAPFGSLSGLMVSVGSATSTIDLRAGESNIVDIGVDGKVTNVTVAVPVASEGGGW